MTAELTHEEIIPQQVTAQDTREYLLHLAKEQPDDVRTYMCAQPFAAARSAAAATP